MGDYPSAGTHNRIPLCPECDSEYDSPACDAFHENIPDEDAMEVIFGDHVRVHITREELEIRDYSDHD